MFSAIAMAKFRQGMALEWPWQFGDKCKMQKISNYEKNNYFFCNLPNSIPLQKRTNKNSGFTAANVWVQQIEYFLGEITPPKKLRCKPKTRGFLFVETLFLFTFGVNISPSLAAVRFRNLH